MATLYHGKLEAQADFDHTFERSETKLYSLDWPGGSVSIHVYIVALVVFVVLSCLLFVKKQDLAPLVASMQFYSRIISAISPISTLDG